MSVTTLRKHYIRNLVVITTVACSLMVLGVGLIAHVSLRDLVIAVLMAIGISSACAAIVGWLFVKFFLRRLLK